MPHISSQKLDPKLQLQLFRQLTGLCGAISKNSAEGFFSSLLTETEQLMLSKRLASVIMLHEGYSQYTVENTLTLSSSTVAKIYSGYTSGKYDSVCSAFSKRKKDAAAFWETIDVLLRLGMPSRAGDRWKFIRK